MQVSRSIAAALLSASLVTMPVWGAPAPKPSAALGTIIAAQHARVGSTSAEVGTTVYGGDSIMTDHEGTAQIRAGAARLLLLNSSNAIVDDSDGTPSAKLLAGTATFSTGNAHAFTLFASKAAIRADSDAPTIGQVTFLTANELIVRSTRGPLAVTVDGETQVISDGTAYRVIIDPPADMMQGPEGAGGQEKGNGRGGPPLRAGRSRFLIIAISIAAGATIFAVYKSLESADRP
jgi:hypothetical protein